MGNFYLYKIADFFTRYLPLSFCYAIAVFISDIQYCLSKKDREAVRDNLRNILNLERVPSSMVREVFHNFAKYLVDFFTLTQRINKEFIKDCVDIEGLEYLNDVLKKGKGGVIVSAHLGNWEMGGAILSLLNYPVAAIALAHRDERVNQFFNAKRKFFGATIIQTNVAIRSCLTHLRSNRLVAILADRDFGHHGLTMNFFGKKSIIPKGAAIFALKTGAPIIPAFFIRTASGRIRITFMNPIDPPVLDEGRISEQNIEALVKTYLPLMEERIRQNPGQWLMFHRFEVA